MNKNIVRAAIAVAFCICSIAMAVATSAMNSALADLLTVSMLAQ